MKYLGDFNLGDTVRCFFNTVNGSDAPFTLAGTPVVVAYVNGGTTEITAGITLTVDFDARTGLHLVSVVASGANGFAVSSDVSLVLSAGTVDGASVVGAEIGSFSIANRAALRPTTAGRTLDVTAGGNAGIDLDNVALTNACPAMSIQASGTLSGTHSATTADLGTNAPSTDISGMTLMIQSRGFVRIIDSYATGTGVATFETTGATLTDGDSWILFATPKASSAAPIPANIKQVNSIAIDGAGTTGDPWGPV